MHNLIPEMSHDKQSRLGRALRGALHDDLRALPWRSNPDPVAGHCYVASEAAYHLTGGPHGPWSPQFMRVDGQPHWFLRHEDDYIWDATSAQFPMPLDYSRAVGKGFLTSHPSKRASILMARVIYELCKDQG